MSNLQIISAYRTLFRRGLQAIQYAKPARFALRDVMRQAFRKQGGRLDGESVKRTVWFLEAAAKERGLEHQVVKNLLLVRLRNRVGREPWRVAYARESRGLKREPFDEHKRRAFEHYVQTIAMLNSTMGLCLPLDGYPEP